MLAAVPVAPARLDCMRVLIVGASGFIGQALAEALVREGHSVAGASRRGDIAVDFAQPPPAAWWRPRLEGFDAVVNAVGILRESKGQGFDAVHTRGPVELFLACAEAGVRRVVQISALGADANATSRYHLSKKAADDALRALPLDAAIVQPSLVYGPAGSSAALFGTLAAVPVLMLPGRGSMQVQPVHIDDVVDGVVRLLRDMPQGVTTITFAGPEPLSMRGYLTQLRAALGIGGRAWVLPFPAGVFMALARVAGRVPGSFLDTDTASMLLRGNAGDVRAFTQLLGRAPRGVDAFLPVAQREPARVSAVVGLWAPVLRVALAALWIWTGVVSFGLYPLDESLALLARVGLHGGVARLALYGAAGFDLLLGVLTLVLPAPHRRWLWPAQLLLIAGYTALISLFLPEYWLHPYGPIIKNIPILAGIALLWALDARGRR